ncbi:MAG: ATP-binding protein [Muribaculaceae bacterium]|nr:ATP-binding protein [Muribaculaceae bacterium]
MTKYPIGEQDFKNVRDGGFVYIDKTSFIETIIKEGGKYYFLARPRRFGKSLFLSTLRYFFEGRRELFDGLHIGSSDWDWKEYPVLRLDLNRERYIEPDKLDDVLDKIFRDWESKYEIDVKDINPAQRFETIIQAAHNKTGRQVVVLVDEYDKPLVSNLSNEENFEIYRAKLASLYSNFKSSAEHLRLVFMTGVSRFSKLSIFSDLNNLNDITFDNNYADVCGITESELLENFGTGIEQLAHEEDTTFEGASYLLKENYDGYRFAPKGSEIYNPWSLLNCLAKKSMGYYWNDTGMPNLLAESLKRIGADLKKTFDTYCREDELKGLDLQNPMPIPLLYQTGYLTIKDYNRKLRQYRLGIPNKEVKSGLFNFLLPYYVSCRRQTPNAAVDGIVTNFILGKPEEALISMQTYFAGIDYQLKIDNENNFHNAFFLLMDLIGLDTETEVHTSDGSIDIKVETPDYIYIIELKYDHDADSALHQIEEKQYARPYRSDERKIFLIGVAFSSATRCIESWRIKQL